MTKKMREALDLLESLETAPVHCKVAVELYRQGVIDVVGFVKGKGAHWNCKLIQKKQLPLFSQERATVSPSRGAVALSCFPVPTFEETVKFFEG